MFGERGGHSRPPLAGRPATTFPPPAPINDDRGARRPKDCSWIALSRRGLSPPLPGRKDRGGVALLLSRGGGDAMTRRSPRSPAGFTLIELLVVIAIIAILIG